MGLDQKVLVDLIKYPILTEKTIRLIEQNQYLTKGMKKIIDSIEKKQTNK